MALFKDFSRVQHFFVGIGLGLLFTIVTVIIAASAAEYKDDAHGGKWDWGDWICTVLGGLVGQALQVAIVFTVIFVH